MARHDNFLAEDVHPHQVHKHLSYMDGFRFGIGLTVGFLAVNLVLGALTWGAILAFGIR